MDVTFNEHHHRENSTREDKKELLHDLSSIPISNSPSCSSIPECIFEPVHELVPRSEPIPETPSVPQGESSFALEDVRFGKGNVFMRRKMAIPEPMQVQGYKSDHSNEVTISNQPLQHENELHMNHDDDQDLPIALG